MEEIRVNPTIPEKHGRLKSIDCLRGCAALAVLLCHAISYDSLPSYQPAWFRIVHTTLSEGHLGVPLFFVLSGFCIHLPWARRSAMERQEKGINYVSFWKRRLRRLYPPYLVTLCMCMSLVVVGYWSRSDAPIFNIYPSPKPYWMGVDFLLHLTMLHGLSPTFVCAGGNPPFWTLAFEEYFYLLYMPLLLGRRRWGLFRSMVLVLLVGLSFRIASERCLAEDLHSFLRNSALVLWVQWCLGMVSVENLYGLVKLPRWRAWPWLIPFWAVCAYASRGNILSPLLWGLVFFTLVNWCVDLETAGKWPRTGFIRWLSHVGIFSYSIYLVHVPARYVLKRCLGPLAVATTPQHFLVITAVMAVAGYYAGRLFFLAVERHFLNPGSAAPSVARPTEPASIALPGAPEVARS